MKASGTSRSPLSRALEAIEEGRGDMAESLLATLPEGAPEFGEALRLRGQLVRDRGALPLAVSFFARASLLHPERLDWALEAAGIQAELGQGEQAEASCLRVLSRDPAHHQATALLSLAWALQGRLAEALQQARRLAGASELDSEALVSLAQALSKLGVPSETLEILGRLGPELGPAPLFIRAQAHRALGRWEEARADFLALHARQGPRWVNLSTLGFIALSMGRPGEALDHLEQALRLNPTRDFHNRAARAWFQLWRPDLALRHMEAGRKARSLGPRLCEGVLFNLRYVPGVTAAWIRDYTEEVARQNYPEGRSAPAPFSNAPDPGRKLRVGYVGGDFRVHAVAQWVEPILKGHDRAGMEVLCFPNNAEEDEATARMKGSADGWHPVHGLSDEDAVALIRSLQVDVLVDLSGFTIGHRMGVFARRAAPVQIGSQMGYSQTTGVPAMDYLLSDEVTDPPGVSEAGYSEKLLRVEGPRVCYSPIPDAPEVGPLPCLLGPPPTFACLSNPDKLNLDALRLFGRVMGEVPGSRLLLRGDRHDPRGLSRRMEAMAFAGLDPERVVLLPPVPQREYLEQFHQIDLALDAGPAFGGTTVGDTLWMGVPVVHLDSPTVPRHGGRGFFRWAGLEEWVVSNEADFVVLAARWAQDPQALAGRRASLRAQVEASMLCNARACCRTLEGAYRKAWSEWCDGIAGT